MHKNKKLELVYQKYLDIGDEIWRNEIHPEIIKVHNKYPLFFNEQQWNENIKLNSEINKVSQIINNTKLTKQQTREQQNILNNLKYQKKLFLTKYIDNLDLTNFYQDINAITKYEDCGPLNHEICSWIRTHSSFKLLNDGFKNTAGTSWGIFDNKNVVVNFQCLKINPITNLNSEVDNRFNDANPYFTHASTYWAILKELSNFDLSLNKVYTTIDKNLKIDKQVDLENRNFDKSFLWNFNDEIKYRMIFTPYMQEYYVNNAFDKYGRFNHNYNLRKKDSFISNKYTAESYSLKDQLNELIKDSEVNLEDIDLLIKTHSINFIHTSYLNLTPLWTQQFLKSIDDKELIEKFKNSKMIPDLPTFHYILNNMFFMNMINGNDLLRFHEIKNCYRFENSESSSVYAAEILEFKYPTFSEIIKASSKNYYTINPETSTRYLFMIYVNNCWRKLWCDEFININRNKEFETEIKPIIIKYKENGILISINKNIVAIYTDYKYDKTFINQIFNEIIEIVKKYN